MLAGRSAPLTSLSRTACGNLNWPAADSTSGSTRGKSALRRASNGARCAFATPRRSVAQTSSSKNARNPSPPHTSARSANAATHAWSALPVVVPMSLTARPKAASALRSPASDRILARDRSRAQNAASRNSSKRVSGASPAFAASARSGLDGSRRLDAGPAAAATAPAAAATAGAEGPKTCLRHASPKTGPLSASQASARASSRFLWRASTSCSGTTSAQTSSSGWRYLSK
mmetsp:Transcript_25876/g.77952  ORF Transcript_25876/g.77952 Transcript_25876/m.77952 type:complete len:231 (+) Transcript_25876:745-1437(+)